MSRRTLEPCPFCGGAVSIARMEDEWSAWYYIHHRITWRTGAICRVFMESEKYGETATEKERAAVRAALIAKWNRRDGPCGAATEP